MKNIIAYLFCLNVIFCFGQDMKLVVPISANGANILDTSRYGRFILTSNYDKFEQLYIGAMFTLWDAKSKRQLKTWVAEKSGFTYNENEIWVYKDSILEVINFQSNSVVALKKGNLYHIEFLGSKPQAVLCFDDTSSYIETVQLWDYDTNKTLKKWEVFSPRGYKLTKNDENLIIHKEDSLFLKPLIDGSEYRERGWLFPELREFEYNAEGDFVIIIYGENFSFQDSTIIDNTACAEYIDLKSGDHHQFQIPNGWYFSFVHFNKSGSKILLTPRFDGAYLFDIKTKKIIGQFSENGTTSFYDDDKIVHYEEDIIQIWEIDLLQIKEEKSVELNSTLREKTLIQYGIKSHEKTLKIRGDSFIADRIISNKKGNRTVLINDEHNASSVIIWDQNKLKVSFTQDFPVYIIDAIFTDNDNKLIFIDNNLYAEVWDVLKGNKLGRFKLFQYENDQFYYPKSINSNENDELIFNFEMLSFRKAERFYYELVEFGDSYEEKIDSSWVHLKFDYSTDGNSQMLFYYEVFRVDPEGVKKDESGTTSIYPIFSLKNYSVSIFDINTGERIQSFEENGLEIYPLGFSANEEFILLDTKKNCNRVRMSLFKGEWFPEELLDSKTITLNEFIEKDNIFEELAKDFAFDEGIYIEEKYEISSFLQTNKISLDSLLEKRGLQRNVDYQIYSTKYDSYDDTWIKGEINFKRNTIDFYFVMEGWNKKEKIFLKQQKLIDFLESDKRFSKYYYEYLLDYCRDPIVGPEKINEFLKKHKLASDHFHERQDSLYFVQIELLFKQKSYKDYWSIKSGERCFFPPESIEYYTPDTVVNVFSYEQMEDGLRIRNKQNNGDSLTLFLFDNDPFLLHSSGFFMGSKNSSKQLHYLSKDLRIVSFDQLDFIYNRPDIVLQKAGCLDSVLIDSYRKAHEKRIRKLGVDPQLYKGAYSVPSMVISNFESELKTNNLEYYPIQIHGFDSLYYLDNYNIYVNEIPIYGKNGYSLRNRRVNSIDTTILIQLSEGENVIEVSATNSYGMQSFRSPLYVTYAPENPYTPKTHFIGIGIDKFSEPGHDLSYSVKDIRDLSKELKEKLGGQLTIDTLFNQNVSVSNVASLRNKLKESNINDNIVIAYSGHGLLNADYDYFLSSYNVDFYHPEKGGIPYEVLESLLDSIPARKKLLLIDACHSGEVDKDDLIQMNEIAGSKGIVEPKGELFGKLNLGLNNSFQLMQELFVNVQKGSGATIISAAAGNQFALEGGGLENGFFTYAILEYMKTHEELAINDLKKFVYEEVERLSGGMQKPTSRLENTELNWRLY